MHEQLLALDRVSPGLVERLASVRGVDGVVLGGSRARGTHGESSDFDLGIYYRGHLDIQQLQTVAEAVSDAPVEVTQPGAWGPWVDGGAWLVIGETHVDLLYRDIGRVEGVWADCQAGRFTIERQVGHPLGFWSHAYAGELALGVPASESSTALASLVAEVSDYPPRLAAALTAALWESTFSVTIARKSVDRGDITYVAGCLFTAVGVMAHALHGHARRWLVNEKGAVAAAARLEAAPSDLEARVAALFASLSADPADLARVCDAAQSIVDEVEVAIS